MKYIFIPLFLFLLTSNLFSQSQDIGISSYYSTLHIPISNQNKCNVDFFKQKLKNGNLEYNYSFFKNDTAICTLDDIIPFYVSITNNRLNSSRIKWDYELYLSFIYRKNLESYYYHEEDLNNDTIKTTNAYLNEYSKDISIGGRINFIIYARKFLKIYISPDIGLGMTFSNKISESIFSMSWTHVDNRLEPIDGTEEFLVNKIYQAKPSGLINFGMLLGFKIPIYKQWGATVEYGKMYIFEHTFNGPDISEASIFIGGGFYYKFHFPPKVSQK